MIQKAETLLERHPLLNSMQEVMWGATAMRFRFELDAPVAELVGNVRCASFCGEEVIVIDSEEFGVSAFPGGVLEPGEDWQRALERELLEEVGARPVSVEVVGRIHFWSGADRPYRSHLPHPEFHQVVSYAAVEIVGAPTNPPDGEHVLSVNLIPVDRAVKTLRAENAWESDLLRFVADVRGVTGKRVR
jgi:ADP-ribose pyrophosphatase YjhB (NUDIX family)